MKKTLLILAVFTLGTTAFSQIPNYVPSNGLVGWWPFNGNANDESGNGNNGTVNGATSSIDRFNTLNSAYHLDGNGDYIYISNSFFNNGSAEMSLSIWYKMDQLSNPNNGNSSHTLFNTSPHNGMSLGMNFLSNSKYNLFLGNGTPAISWNTSIFNAQSNQNCAANSWHHILLVKSGVTYLLYIDGVLDNTWTSNISILSYFYEMYFGSTDPSVSNEVILGSLDDIGIWNRALTECEIQDLYHAQLNSASMNISAGLDQSICSGDNVTLSGAGGNNYQWNNNVVDGQAFAPAQSNAYIVTAQDTLGCTGTDTVVVTVLENANSTLTQTALDSYTLNGQTYTQSGTYTQTLTAANGCDSTITLNLTLNFTGIDELGTGAKKLVKITDLNGKIMLRRKNTLMLFIYEDGTVERVVEMEE
jgi:hypothetical protein